VLAIGLLFLCFVFIYHYYFEYLTAIPRARGGDELAKIISYPTGANGIIVLQKNSPQYHSLPLPKKTARTLSLF